MSELCSVSGNLYDQCDGLDHECVWQCGTCGGNVYNCICLDQDEGFDFREEGRLAEMEEKEKFALFRILEFCSSFDGVDDVLIRQAYQEFESVFLVILRLKFIADSEGKSNDSGNV